MDIDGSEFVTVDDLLQVIGQWSDCGDGTYRPTADVNGDCCVTVDDLLEVIGHWGDYCGPTGACCLPSGSCADVSQLDCDDQSGIFQGEGTDCFAIECPIPGACCLDADTCMEMLPDACEQLGGTFRGPTTACVEINCSQSDYNDDCQDSWSISDGLWDFQTLTATTDGPQHPECKYKGQTFNDIWFRYVAPATGTLVVSTCDLADYDTDLVLYEGWNCYDFTMINCSEDAPDCSGYTSHMESPVIGGQQYMIRVGGWGVRRFGDGPVAGRPPGLNRSTHEAAPHRLKSTGGCAWSLELGSRAQHGPWLFITSKASRMSTTPSPLKSHAGSGCHGWFNAIRSMMASARSTVPLPSRSIGQQSALMVFPP